MTRCKKLFSAVLYCVVLLLAAPASAEQIYRWVGADGATHFSETPPAVEGADVEVLEDLSQRVFITQADLSLVNMQFNKDNWRISDVDPDGDVDNLIAGFHIVDETGIIDLTQTNLHVYRVYGYYNRPTGLSRGESLVEVGYKRRF